MKMARPSTIVLLTVVLLLNGVHSFGQASDSPEVRLGVQAPELEVLSWSDGNEHSLESLNGQTVLVNLTSTRCAPCELAANALVKIREQYSDKPFKILTVFSAESDAREVEEYRLRYRGCVTGIDATLASGEGHTFNEYGNRETPNFVLIGPDGLIKYNSSMETESKIKQLLLKHGGLAAPPTSAVQEKAHLKAIAAVWHELLSTQIDQVIEDFKQR